MIAPRLREQPASDAVPARLITRIVLDHAFQASTIWKRAFGGDHLSSLVWPSIDLANTEYIFSHEGLFHLFLNGKFPDTLRRPISVRALGASLALDVETIRRSTKRLVERGLCEHLPAGMIVKSASYGLDHIAAASQQTLVVLSSLFGEFEKWSVRFPAIAPLAIGDFPWEQSTVNAAVTRRLSVLLLMEFVLRYTIENISIFDHNLITAEVFLCVFTENNRPFTEDEELAWRYALIDAPPPDQLRRPMSMRSIARLTGFPAETTRRHVNRLVEMGFVERRDDGLMVPMSVVVRPDFVKVIGNLNASLLLMTRRMQRLSTDQAALETR